MSGETESYPGFDIADRKSTECMTCFEIKECAEEAPDFWLCELCYKIFKEMPGKYHMDHLNCIPRLEVKECYIHRDAILALINVLENKKKKSIKRKLIGTDLLHYCYTVQIEILDKLLKGELK